MQYREHPFTVPLAILPAILGNLHLDHALDDWRKLVNDLHVRRCRLEELHLQPGKEHGE